MMTDTEVALRVLAGDTGEHAHKAAPKVKAYDAGGKTDEQPWFTSSAGLNYTTETDAITGDMVIRAYQDVYAILEANKAMFNHNNGYTPDKTFQRVASVPASVRNKILIETNGGVDLWKPETDPKWYKRFMNSNENLAFRTAAGRL